MARKPNPPIFDDLPLGSDSPRFADWTLENVIPLEANEMLVNDDPEDPNRLAKHGTKKPKK
jgi:hypothetical protein